MSLPSSPLSILAFLALALGFFPLKFAAAFEGGDSPACTTIKKYESLCRHLGPQDCVRFREGFDYWNNPEHKQAWDAFFQLCGEDPDRNSHACIAFLGIGDSCISTVPPPPPEVTAYREPLVFTVREPVPQVEAYRAPERLCLYSEGTDAIESFLRVCGDVRASECPQAEVALTQVYTRWCGDRTPCQCADEISCGSPQCPVTGPAPVAPPSGSGTMGSEGVGRMPEAVPPPTAPTSPDSPMGSSPAVDSEEPPRLPEVSTGGAPSSTQGAGLNDSTRAGQGGLPNLGAFAMSGSGCSLQAVGSIHAAEVGYLVILLLPLLGALRRRA